VCQLYLTLEEIRRGERRRTGVLDMLQGSQYLVWYFQVTHTQLDTYAHTHAHSHTLIQLDTYANTHMHTLEHICTHTYTHTHMHRHIHTDMHTYSHIIENIAYYII
jgi:hypothetical protein